ncbi:MAG: ATP-binding protein [Leeuwenhoekiella sp.]
MFYNQLLALIRNRSYKIIGSGLLVLNCFLPSAKVHGSVLKKTDTSAVAFRKIIDNATSSHDYTKALEVSKLYLKSVKKKGAYHQLFDAQTILSKSHLRLQDTAMAIEVAKSGFTIALKTDNDSLIGEAFANLGGLLVLNKASRLLGYNHLKKSLDIKRRNEQRDLYAILVPLIQTAETLKRYEEMQSYIVQLEMQNTRYSTCEDDRNNALAQFFRANYYENIGQPNFALKHYAIAYNKVEKHKLEKLSLMVYKRYGNALKSIGHYQQALAVKEKLHKLLYAQQERDHQKSIAFFDASKKAELYKSELKSKNMQKTIAEEKHSKKVLKEVGFCLFTLALCLFIIILMRHVRSRQELIKSLEKNNVVLRKTKVKLQKSLSARNTFFATLSHELRTPLFGITGIVNLIQKDPTFDNHREDLNSLKFSAEHLLQVINDLLEMSRIESTHFKLKERPFDLKLLLKEIISSFKHHNEENSNVLQLEISDDLPTYVIGDSGRIAQILINIIGNSIKFTKQGCIHIRLWPCQPSQEKVLIHFEVEDNGIGIPWDKQDKVFNEFEHFHLDETTSHPGTGLGLSIVKKILTAMDGSIQLKSTPQQGTTITFGIPFKELTLEEVMVHSQYDKLDDLKFYHKSLEGSNILVVDDNRISRVITTKILEERKINISSADCGKKAIAMTKKCTFDLVLMDINMPGMDGFETAEAINQYRPGLPIVALTASDADFINIRLRDSCMKGAITKPYEIDDFLNKILFHISTAKTLKSA